jgi:hypothetical protein
VLIDLFADEQLQKYGLNERQMKALQYVRVAYGIENSQKAFETA